MVLPLAAQAKQYKDALWSKTQPRFWRNIIFADVTSKLDFIRIPNSKKSLRSKQSHFYYIEIVSSPANLILPLFAKKLMSRRLPFTILADLTKKSRNFQCCRNHHEHVLNWMILKTLNLLHSTVKTENVLGYTALNKTATWTPRHWWPLRCGQRQLAP